MKLLTEASIFLANYSNEICFMLNFSFSSNLKVIKWSLFKQAPNHRRAGGMSLATKRRCLFKQVD